MYRKMRRKCESKPCETLLEVVQIAKDLRNTLERVSRQRDELLKDLSITKTQLEELEKHIETAG